MMVIIAIATSSSWEAKGANVTWSNNSQKVFLNVSEGKKKGGNNKLFKEAVRLF